MNLSKTLTEKRNKDPEYELTTEDVILVQQVYFDQSWLIYA